MSAWPRSIPDRRALSAPRASAARASWAAGSGSGGGAAARSRARAASSPSSSQARVARLSASASVGGQLVAQAGRLVVEGGDERRVDGDRQVPVHRPAALGHHRGQAPGPLPQRLQPPGVLAQAGPAGGVELVLHRRDGRVELPQLGAQQGLGVDQPGPGLRGRLLVGAEGRQLASPQVEAQVEQLGGQVAVAAGGVGLLLQGLQLAADLPQQVGEADQVGLGAVQAALGLLLAAAELEDAGRLLDDQAAVLGAGVEDGVEVALGHDEVLLAPDAGVGEQLLDVEQPAGHAVQGVLALARRAEQRAGDRHLVELDRQEPGRVVDGEADLGPAQGGTPAGAGEDDVVHLGRADGSGALGAEHPGHRVHHVGLAAAVRADDDSDPRFELQGGGLGEGLEALQGQRAQKHRCPKATGGRGPFSRTLSPVRTGPSGAKLTHDDDGGAGIRVLRPPGQQRGCAVRSKTLLATTPTSTRRMSRPVRPSPREWWRRCWAPGSW